MPKTFVKNDYLRQFADSLTPQQVIALMDRLHGPVPAEIRAMSDDELCRDLRT